jgi:hypothetical protein
MGTLVFFLLDTNSHFDLFKQMRCPMALYHLYNGFQRSFPQERSRRCLELQAHCPYLRLSLNRASPRQPMRCRQS